jgi:hypothetical protein
VKARELLTRLQAMIAGYDQILENIPRANEIMDSAKQSQVYTTAQVNTLTAARARLMTMCDKLTARLEQEVSMPEL